MATQSASHPSATGAPTILERPLVSFGRETCGDLDAALRREWLVANGLGGYASGTLAGVNTRRYHGLLVATLTPPVGRTVLVGGLVEWASYDGRRYPLSAHEYDGGTIDPHGYRHLQTFTLDGMLPVWTFALADALLERRVWMAYGENTTYVTYRLVRASSAVALEIMPLITFRDFHSLSAGGQAPAVELSDGGATVRASENAPPLRLLSAAGRYEAGGDWYWNFHHREEAARGLDHRSDLYAPGRFTAALRPGELFTLALSVEAEINLDAERALARARERQMRLLRDAHAEQSSAAVQQLTLAADQFIVERRGVDPSPGPSPLLRRGEPDRPSVSSTAIGPATPREELEEAVTRGSPLRSSGEGPGEGATHGTTVIAGYHWFNDWGRDTMIALPGLTLAAGRPADAAGILRTFGRYVSGGLLPNNFPDASGAEPGYNTVDATLWYVLAVYAYGEATGDEALVDELLPILREVVEQHILGTRHGIGMDAADGLLHAGEPGVQLTWMDAKVGDWVVTPRIGKPVEINALWYNALRVLAALLAARGDRDAARYDALAARTGASFRARFVRPDRAYLADVIDGPNGDDLSLRPNQIFALSLPFPLLEGEAAARLLDAVGRTLLTSYGLRSLSADDPAYRGDYGGDPLRRDGGYHQGPVWPWLLGAFAEAYDRVHGDAAALALLFPIEDHLRDAGLGSVSEILEGDPPHLPRGCIAQAWSVSEILRVWRSLEDRVNGPGRRRGAEAVTHRR